VVKIGIGLDWGPVCNGYARRRTGWGDGERRNDARQLTADAEDETDWPAEVGPGPEAIMGSAAGDVPRLRQVAAIECAR